ncbi:hypothetical protein CYMTET_47180 [Cymbomonas tetramitiformis]|uniref:DNA methylase N-4/N-6 domain-containing protein n=1 Tax=Cymbomonas tetramitiformis TaxID=36881 RepID=A0AAE0BWP7_9CHLO|nr:hypothetical protein CYMTET_47180 [Cymbomonas tetramitiformis]
MEQGDEEIVSPSKTPKTADETEADEQKKQAAIRKEIDDMHKLVDNNNPCATSWRIPIQYIDDAEGAHRPRPLDEHHAQAIAEMMYWNPHTGSGSPALISVIENHKDPTSTNPEAFVWADIGKGRYRFTCFGHQHLLEAKRRCVKADEAKHANHENRTEAFQFIECRLFMNLSAIEMNQLGNEQNNIDAYMKHRNMTEIILGMRKHVEKLMAEPNERDVGMKSFENLKYRRVPPKQNLNPEFEAALKTQVFNHQKLNADKKNTHWAAWAISVQSYQLFKQLQRVMKAHNEGLLEGVDPDNEDATETTLATVGSSRNKRKRSIGMSTGTTDLNAPTTKQPKWDPTAGKPIVYHDLPKGFYESWAPLTEGHLREITDLVDEAVIERKYTVKDMINRIAEIKTLNNVRENLMLLASEAHKRFNITTSLESTPAYRQLSFLKKNRHSMQLFLQTQPGGFENDIYDIDAPCFIPYLDEDGYPIPKERKPVDAVVDPGAPESKFWARKMTYGELDAEIIALQKKLDTFTFPNPEQDWEKFCEYFPGAGDEREIRTLLKAGVVPPKVSCKNEQENRKFQFEQRPAKEKQRHEEKIEKLIKNIPKDIKFYWNNIESRMLLKIGSTTASTAENILKDLPGVSYRILSNVPEGQQVDDDDYFYTHKIPQLVFKKDFLLEPASPESFTTLPRLPFTGFIMDCEYALDSNKKWFPKPLLAGEFKQFLHNFNNLTTCDDWVGGCFCGFQQHHEFFEAAKQFCHGNAEKMFWVKPLSRSNMMTLESGVAPRNYANRMECFVLCYYVKEATPTDETHPAVHKRLPWMKNLIRVLGEEENADSDVVDKQFVASCRTNTWEYAPVHSSKFAINSEGKRINKHQKPLKLIHDLINIHMRGPELEGEARGKSAYEGVLPLHHEHHFILDACCGSGTTSVAANMLGLGSVAFDRERHIVKSKRKSRRSGEEDGGRNEGNGKGRQAAGGRGRQGRQAAGGRGREGRQEQQAEAAEADKAAKQQQAEAVKAAKKEKADAEKAAKQQADAEKAAKKQKAEADKAAKKQKAEAEKAAKAQPPRRGLYLSGKRHKAESRNPIRTRDVNGKAR